MVGTFYPAPSPIDPAYVQIGSKLSQNTIVCIVEAMKLFNEIEAEIKGEIVEMLVKDGELVEYGQPLFLVKPRIRSDFHDQKSINRKQRRNCG